MASVTPPAVPSLPCDPNDVNACLVLMMTEPHKAAVVMHYLRSQLAAFEAYKQSAERVIEAATKIDLNKPDPWREFDRLLDDHKANHGK